MADADMQGSGVTSSIWFRFGVRLRFALFMEVYGAQVSAVSLRPRTKVCVHKGDNFLMQSGSIT